MQQKVGLKLSQLSCSYVGQAQTLSHIDTHSLQEGSPADIIRGEYELQCVQLCNYVYAHMWLFTKVITICVGGCRSTENQHLLRVAASTRLCTAIRRYLRYAEEIASVTK
jgi:hypothetical protein